MGIKGLMKLISDNVPSAIKEKDISAFFGRKIAIDASMALYQFLIAVRNGAENEMLTNENGEVTSHLQGLFYRTLRMLDAGIKPVYVFDGKPPQLKGGELAERKEKREEAEEKLKAATEAENQEEMNKYAKRLVHVTKEHNSEARRLLRAMGIPVVEAPGEAEAQCAQLAKEGKVFGVATEDMDALTFGTPVLLRHLSASAARKLPIVEIHLNTVLNGLKLSQEEFVDLCILCGCDYTGSIKGIGPAKAYQLIQTHKSIEKALNYVDKNKYKVPDDFLYKEAAQLFHTPEVHQDSIQLQWTDPNEDELIKFLVDEKGFNLERVTTGIKRLKACKNKGAQQRMDTFFKMPATSKPISSSSSSSSSSNKSVSIVKKEENETTASKSIEEKSSTASESSSFSPKKSRSKKVIKEEEEEASSISLCSAAAASPIKPAKNEKSPQKKTSTAPSAKATAWASFFAPKAKSKTAVSAETVKTEEDDDDSMDIEKKKPKRRLIDDEGEAELQMSVMETVKAEEVEEEPKKKKGRPASPKRRSASPKPE